MSTLTRNGGSSINPAAAAALEQAGANLRGAQAAPDNRPKAASGWSFAQLGANSARKASNASLSVLRDNMAKYAEKEFAAKLVVIDRDQTAYSNLAFSAIVVVTESEGKAFSHTLMFEHTGEDVPAKDEQIPNGGSFQWHRTNDTAWDKRYIDAVNSAVASVTNLQHVSTDGQLVRRTVAIDKPEDADALLRQAMVAIETMRFEYSGAGRISMTDADPSTRLNSTLRQNQAPLVAFDNTYNRADWSITVNESQVGQNTNQESVNNGQVTALVAQITGYVDVIPTEVIGELVNPFVPQLPQQQQVQGKFIPMVVMTTMDNLLFNTVSGQLMALGAAALVMRDPAALYPHFSVAGLDSATQARRDPAALNIQGNLERSPSGNGAILADIAGGRATDQQLGQYLQAMLKPEVAIAIRVSNFGADSWVNGVFSRAADGDLGAQQLILDRANALTGGGLANGDRFSVSKAVVEDVEEVLLGTYKAADGSIRDIADMDYIAVANAFHADAPAIGQYLATIYNLSTPWKLRLETRAGILREVLGSSVNITGHGRLVKFTGEFIAQFCNALVRTGRAPGRVNGTGNAFQTGRYTPAWANQAATAYAAAPVAGQSGRANTYGGAAYSTARSWGY